MAIKRSDIEETENYIRIKGDMLKILCEMAGVEDHNNLSDADRNKLARFMEKKFKYGGLGI